MKEGFETLKDGLDLAEYAMEGYLGVFVYIVFGAVATVVIQSSSATMAIIITALATGQIDYINALSLAIGANIGTTVTAILGALASNQNGKRLAVAHFIFNIITGLFAVVFIYQLKALVDFLAPYLGIPPTDDAMHLALFHTIFNVAGVLICTPFLPPMVRFLDTLFLGEEVDSARPRYLTDEVMEIPAAALAALRKESVHLYDRSLEAIVHAMNLHRSEIFSDVGAEEVVEKSIAPIDIDVEKVYQKQIKSLYSEIIRYASITQSYMNEEGNRAIYELKLAVRKIIEMVKDVGELQKNLNYSAKTRNANSLEIYNKMRAQLIAILREIQEIRVYEGDEEEVLTQIEMQKALAKENENRLNREVDSLIRQDKIDSNTASSLINDIGFAQSISKKLLTVAGTLWLKNEELKELGDEYENE
jgi:phosphate:Na+ symporter